MLKDMIKVGIFGGVMTGIVYGIGRLDGRIEILEAVNKVFKETTEEK